MDFDIIEDEDEHRIKELSTLDGISVNGIVGVLVEKGCIIPDDYAVDLGEPDKKKFDTDGEVSQ